MLPELKHWTAHSFPHCYTLHFSLNRIWQHLYRKCLLRAAFTLTSTDRPVVTPGGQGLRHSLASDALWSLQHIAVITGELDAGSNAIVSLERKKKHFWRQKERKHAKKIVTIRKWLATQSTIASLLNSLLHKYVYAIQFTKHQHYENQK